VLTRKSRAPGNLSIVLPVLLTMTAIVLAAVVWRRRVAPRKQRNGKSRHVRSTAIPTEPSSDLPDVQRTTDGSGPLIHRTYDIVLGVNGLTTERIVALMKSALTDLAPSALADFEKTVGSSVKFSIGDEYDITMLGPWNGRVRVQEVGARHFTLVTLDGHPEAGHITFSAASNESDGMHSARIESVARSRDRVVQAAYSGLGIGKRVQAEVWVTFLQRLGELAGSTTVPEVTIASEELIDSDSRAFVDG
jgi:Domain of unknown function (DUF1990)